jgi:A/G-specific adenine glycosylase
MKVASPVSHGLPRTLPENKLLPFHHAINRYYHEHPRSFPWRETADPYRILVSEFMLQQTQTERVLKYYDPFIRRFPDFPSLAASRLKDVLEAWQGLGYNRRAVNLRMTAQKVTGEYGGVLPDDKDDLVTLPGIGEATAGAIQAFAFDKPVVFIETNIRRVFIHFFFQDKSGVKDAEIFPLVEQTLDHDNPRHWYYALMDYGAMLKKTVPNPNKKSAHYSRQAPFEGSDRQVRGKIIRELLEYKEIRQKEFLDLLNIETERAKKIFQVLEHEGFLVCSEDTIRLL